MRWLRERLPGVRANVACVDGWCWPFAWVLLASFLTASWRGPTFRAYPECALSVLASGTVRVYDCTSLEVTTFRADLPGMMSLLAFVWLCSSQRRVRWAAMAAG